MELLNILPFSNFSEVNSRQAAKYIVEIHRAELFYLPKDVYFCPSYPRICTTLPKNTAWLVIWLCSTVVKKNRYVTFPPQPVIGQLGSIGRAKIPAYSALTTNDKCSCQYDNPHLYGSCCSLYLSQSVSFCAGYDKRLIQSQIQVPKPINCSSSCHST